MPTAQKTYELIVEPRRIIGKQSSQLRRQHLVPAVLYGYGVEPTPVQVDQHELERVYHRAGSNSLIDLRIDGASDGGMRRVFIHDVQRDPVKHTLLHVDFFAVNLREEMTAAVPLVIVGEAPAVKAGLGMLMQQLDHVQVRSLPTDLPSAIEVDISGLVELDQSIHVSDLPLPENVVVLTDGDEPVAKIAEMRVAAEEVEEVEEAEEAEGAEEAGAEGADEGEGATETEAES